MSEREGFFYQLDILDDDDLAVEGENFIFDRYAYLKISRDADENDIRRAITKRRAENHPDRLKNLSDEIKEAANRVLELLALVESVLLDKEKRKVYNQQLAHFDEHDPESITTDGNIEIDAFKERVVLGTLTTSKERDIPALRAATKKTAEFDEVRLEQARKLYESDPGNDIFRDLYKNELRKKLLHLEVMEIQLWSDAGVEFKDLSRRVPMNLTDYVKLVDQEIEEFSKNLIPEKLDQRQTALTIGIAQPLLLTDGSQQPASETVESTTTQISTEVRDMIDKNFRDRIKSVKDVAAEIQEVIGLLAELTEYEYLQNGPTKTDLCDVYLHQQYKGEETVMLIGTLNKLNGNLDKKVGILWDSNVDDIRQLKGENDVVIVHKRIKDDAKLSGLAIGAVMRKILKQKEEQSGNS